MKIRTKLLSAALAIGLIPALIVGSVSWFQSRNALKNQAFSHLESVREIKKAQIESFFVERMVDLQVLLEMVANLKQNAVQKLQSLEENEKAQIVKLEEIMTLKLLGEQEDFFAKYVRKYHYYDLFLIHPQGKIFYTVKHETDYGTNLLHGEYADSQLGSVFQKVLKSKAFAMSDFAPYPPSHDEPAAFIAQPLLNNDKIELIVALQLSDKAITQIMQERTGMGETGETYLVGQDKLMRSDSYIDPIYHSIKASFANPISGTVDTEATRAALSGKTGHKIMRDYRDVAVLSAYTPLNIGDINWAVIAEIDLEEAFKPISHLQWQLFIIALLMGRLVFTLTRRFTEHLTKPLLLINQHLKILAQGKMFEDDIDYSKTDEIGELVTSTRTLKEGIKNTIIQANAIAAGDYTQEVKLLSEQDQLGKALSEMIQRLWNIAAISEAIAGGDYNYGRIEVKGQRDRLAQSMNTMLENLSEVVSQVNKISHGDYTSNIAPKSDQDILGIALQKMNQRLREMSAENDKQNWIKTGQYELSKTMRGDLELVVLSRKTLTFLAKYLSAQVGALYLYNEKNEELKLIATYAFKKRKSLNDSFKIGEGLIGQAALEREMISITEIPEDYTRIISAVGEAVPRNVVVIPFIYEEKLEGVIELGAFQAFPDTALEFLQMTMENIAIVINSSQSRTRMKELLEETQTQAEELTAQQEELKQSNEELAEHTRTLKANEEKLQIQKENLESANLALNKTRRELEKKAVDFEKSSQYKSEFLANMSHELRTPLNSILILSQQLAENEEGNLTDMQVESAKIVYNSGQDLLALINEILDLSKVEAGKMDVIIEKIWLNNISSILTSNFKALIDKKGLVLLVNLSQDLPEFIMSDHQRLNQILKNLMSNAIKFTSQGSITIDFRPPDAKIDLSRSGLEPQKSIAISVIDTGIGIPKNKQPEVFKAFQQIDGGISRKYGGTGLGLSISKELAKLLGGEIQLHSVEGEGSTFTLYIPEILKASEITDEEPVVQASKGFEEQELFSKPLSPFSQKKDDDMPLHGKKILLVDDDMRNLFALSSVLQKEGIEVYKAANGKKCLDILTKTPTTDMVIMDVMMPVMDGYEAMQAIRAQKQFAHLPIIALTAKAMKEDREKSIAAGANDYLSKPVDIEQLLSLIRVWLYK
ncbi:MAG: hypothetical protein DRQ49_11920 [Gammaproteobacteria bacterium]|nr:MAG: hypothetical protein DRQ49_11920 [Gammaproteobacteria bacterium]RKZ41220.1 MAG: hypothetical protein DRQ41_08485 [Gammaproteobacteria bacterium]RKZ74079.1 MAG: hypothetical protein DRQ57_12260 [Gammaproteobacteria bacterium]